VAADLVAARVYVRGGSDGFAVVDALMGLAILAVALTAVIAAGKACADLRRRTAEVAEAERIFRTIAVAPGAQLPAGNSRFILKTLEIRRSISGQSGVQFCDQVATLTTIHPVRSYRLEHGRLCSPGDTNRP